MDTSNFENFSKSSDYLLLVTLFLVSSLKIKLICNFLVLKWITFVMKFVVVFFFLQFTCVFVDGSFMFESLLLCTYGP